MWRAGLLAYGHQAALDDTDKKEKKGEDGDKAPHHPLLLNILVRGPCNSRGNKLAANTGRYLGKQAEKCE